MDQQLLAKIAQIFEQLQCRLSLLDEGGACLVPHDDTLRPLPDITDENTIATMFGARYLRVPKAGCLLSAPEGTPDDVLRMAKNLIEALVQLSATSGGSMFIFVISQGSPYAEYLIIHCKRGKNHRLLLTASKLFARRRRGDILVESQGRFWYA